MYLQIAQEIKRSRQKYNLLYVSRLYPVGRLFSAYLTPLLVKLGVSANGVTYFRYLAGLAAVLSVFLINIRQVYIPVVLYFVYYFLDYVDGDVARARKESSFVGRYIEAMSDIHIDSLILLALAYLGLKETGHLSWFWMGSTACFLTTLANLNIDRYSAFRRWIKEEQGVDVGSHALSDPMKITCMLVYDFIFICLIWSIFQFVTAALCILTAAIVWNAVLFFYHMRLVYKNMSGISDKPKHDGTGRVR